MWREGKGIVKEFAGEAGNNQNILNRIPKELINIFKACLLVNTLSHAEPIISSNKGRKGELFKAEEQV